MHKYLLTCILSLLLFSNQIQAQKSLNLASLNCYSAPVQYTIDGQLKQGQIVFINYNDPEMPALQFSDVYLLNKNRENRKLTNDSNAFYSVYDMKVSENHKYIALLMVGEGHPWIEIYDLQKLISEQKQELIADINPYPGNINMLKWYNNELFVESDINLTLKNENKELGEENISEIFSKFIFNVETKKYKKK